MARPDVETLLEQIRAGKTYRELAEEYGVSHPTICNWLNAAPDQSARASALLDSAEAWLDRGLDAVERAMDKDGRVDASAARAYAQECARRAAIRNPKYRDKVDHGSDPERPLINVTRIELTALK